MISRLTKWLSCLLAMSIGHALCLCPATAETNNWVGGTSGFWTNDANWSLASTPGSADDVVISSNANVAVVLDTSVEVASLTLTNSGSGTWSTVIFTNWNTCLTAANAFVSGGGRLTHYLNTDTNAPWQGDSRVYVVCTNLTVAAGGVVNADSVGYAGGPGTTGKNGHGPGGGVGTVWSGSGGGYGGRGGRGHELVSIVVGVTNGWAAAPDGPGSGGGSAINFGRGGNGGGAIWIEAGGTGTVDGTITANGENSPAYAAGSGGGIYLRCGTFSGSGMVQADGGRTTSLGGNGGGGRITVLFDQAIAPTVRFSVGGGRGGANSKHDAYCGRPGSLYLSTYDGVLPSLITNGLDLVSPPTWSAPSLTVSNAVLVLSQPGFSLSVAGLMSVVGSSTIYLYSDPISGVPPAGFFVGSFLVEAGAAINADHNGYGGGNGTHYNGYGPGGGVGAAWSGGGGGYGGVGGHGGNGDPTTSGGPTNGSLTYPFGPGSGGGGSGNGLGGNGGGAIRVEATGAVTVNGLLSANGGAVSSFTGGGSGGAIYIRCHTMAGTGTNQVNGGAANSGPSGGGGGGGGRIAVYCSSSNFNGTCVVAAGAGGNSSTSGVGTVYWSMVRREGTVIFIR